MAGIKIKWNMIGFEIVRRSSKVKESLEDLANALAEDCGNGYEGGISEGHAGKTLGRSRGYVVTTNNESVLDNARNNTLVKALGGRHIG